LDLEQIDLASLADRLQTSRLSLEGYLRGRTEMRDAVIETLACSELEAEQLVDTLVGRGFVQFSGDPASAGGGGVWTIHPDAS
jgi:hypothetical protein